MSYFNTFKNLALLCCGISLLFACHNGSKEQKSPKEDTLSTSLPTPRFPSKKGSLSDLREAFSSSGLIQWKRKIKKDYPHFSVEDFSSSKKERIAPSSFSPYSRKAWKTFNPYFISSPNNQYAIDLQSYHRFSGDSSDPLEGGSPDNAVNLVHLSTQSKKQLLFAGPGTLFQDAQWINDSIVLITGESDANKKNKMQPICWKFNIFSNTMVEFHYREPSPP